MINVSSSSLIRGHFQAWYARFVGLNTPEGRFMKQVEENAIKVVEGEYITCDQIAMAAALNPAVIKRAATIPCQIELHGSLTRGQCVLDWHCKHFTDTPKIKIITGLDHGLYSDLLMTALKGTSDQNK